MFPRIPVLLPSFTFLIAIILILQFGILPMSIYQGENQTIHNGVLTKDNMTFEVYPSGIVYEDTTYIDFQTAVGLEQYFLLTIEFFNNGIIAETINLNLTGWSIYSLELDQGLYTIQVNGTFFESGIPQQDGPFLNLIFYQQTRWNFEMEVISWSSYQYFLFVVSVFFILVGFFIDRKDRKEKSKVTIDIV